MNWYLLGTMLLIFVPSAAIWAWLRFVPLDDED
jgi:hypothetical protein